MPAKETPKAGTACRPSFFIGIHFFSNFSILQTRKRASDMHQRKGEADKGLSSYFFFFWWGGLVFVVLFFPSLVLSPFFREEHAADSSAEERFRGMLEEEVSQWKQQLDEERKARRELQEFCCFFSFSFNVLSSSPHTRTPNSHANSGARPSWRMSSWA